MIETTSRSDIAHAIVLLIMDGLDSDTRRIDDYLAFPCHLCGRPMEQEPGECHSRCVAEENADRSYDDDNLPEIPF